MKPTHKGRLENLPPASTALVSQDALALMARATAEQHRAVLQLQSLFAHRGGIVSQHQVTGEHPEHVIKELEECRSFAVINLSPITLQVGWGGRLATGGGATPVAPFSFLQLPVECNNCEVSAEPAALSAAPAVFLFVRYRHLVHLAAGNLGTGGREGLLAQTGTSPAAPVAVKAASVQVIAANQARRGLEIINTGATAVSLGLGRAAVVKTGVYLEPGGSWSGTISGLLWQGEVTGICAAGETTLAVVEV
jgi:hypothetical protein